MFPPKKHGQLCQNNTSHFLVPIVPICVLVCLSLSMIKHYDQKELVVGEGLFVFKKKKSSSGETKARTQGTKLEARMGAGTWGGDASCWLLSTGLLPRFLVQSRMVYSGVVPPTVGWALPYH